MMIAHIKRVTLIILAAIVSLNFLSACGGKNADASVFVGQWREARHGKGQWYENDAITIDLNKDKTFSLNIPGSSTHISGTWSVGSIDTNTFLALEYRQRVREIDEDYYGGREFPLFYFFRVKNAEKGKLLLVDMSRPYVEKRFEEHLFKPLE